MHPVKLASALLTLQEYSKGRAALVIGGGGEWLARLAIEPVKRVRCVREAIELVRGGVSGKPLTYKGEMYKVYGYSPAFGAAAAPLVYAGANQPQMLRAAAPAADAVMYSDMTRDRIRDTVAATHAALAAKGRRPEDYRISNIWAWHVKADRQVALREARRELLLRGLLERWYLQTFLLPEECDLIERNKAAFYAAYRDRSGEIKGVPEDIVGKCLANLTFTGTPDEIGVRLPELRAFKAAGVGELCLRLHDDPADAIRLIGEHVVPALS
jgi:alkanesulfonate monooxygenase SsuD/methylene tetrahydromethanopterin reductase-like flavin-dependent oxidoreductase (luciferase family)